MCRGHQGQKDGGIGIVQLNQKVYRIGNIGILLKGMSFDLSV